MIRKVVLVRLKAAHDAAEVKEIQQGFLSLGCPGTVSYTLGDDLSLREGNWSLAIVADFTDAGVVHFDVDAVDSRDLPLANYPHHGLGVPLVVAAEVLPVFYRVPRLRAAVFTEVNASYDPSASRWPGTSTPWPGPLRAPSAPLHDVGAVAAGSASSVRYSAGLG